MNDKIPDAQGSDLPGYREELAAEIAVEKMLIRIRLEDAAEGPSLGNSPWSWVVRVAAVIGIIQIGWNHEYQQMITYAVAFYILLGDRNSQVHARIDAILKLAELDKKEAQAAAALADESLK